MRLLILAEYRENNLINGSLRHIYNLVESLSKKVDLHIITLGESDTLITRSDRTIYTLKKRLIPLTLRPIKKLIKAINPDLIHAIGGVPYSTVVVSVSKKYPTVCSILGYIEEESKFYKKKEKILAELFDIANQRRVIKQLPNIIVQVPYLKKLLKMQTKSSLFLVPEGREIDVEVKPNKDSPDIFISERLTELKGLDILIKIIPKLVRSFPTLKVYIAGIGEEENNLKELAKKLDVNKNIIFLGKITDEELVSYYKSCKIVVSPSRWDLDPFPPINASIYGKPAVVSSKCHSFTKDGEDGFVFNSTGSLIKQIKSLLSNNRLREEMGKKALENSKIRDWDNISERLIKIYGDIIENTVRV